MPVAKLIQDAEEEPNSLTRRIHQLVELHENREKVYQNLTKYQEKMKAMFEKNVKNKNFQPGYLLFRWDVKKEDKGKHGKFDPLWFGPFRITKAKGNNTFILENFDGELLSFL